MCASCPISLQAGTGPRGTRRQSTVTLCISLVLVHSRFPTPRLPAAPRASPSLQHSTRLPALGLLRQLLLPQGHSSLPLLDLHRNRFLRLLYSALPAHNCSFALPGMSVLPGESFPRAVHGCCPPGCSWTQPCAPHGAPSWQCCSAEQVGCGALGPQGDSAPVIALGVGSRPSWMGIIASDNTLPKHL